MKSAYGRQIPAPDYELTSVGPGTPMGELLRRYWQPVCLSDELRDLPKKVKLLDEEIVVFRDKRGRVGALEPHCAHRGASLEWGRIEEDGIRCCYHGWLYDVQGQCLDMPCESEEFRKRMNIWQEAYPTHEYGGLVFAYMGPPGTEPLFPMYDIIDTRYRGDVELRGMRVWGDYSAGYVKDCNWLQHYENIVDPYHLLVLHKMISGEQFVGAMMQRTPQLGLEKTSLGVRYRFVNDLPNGNRLVRYVECVVPNIFLIANIHEPGTVPMRQDRPSEFSWVVPIDDVSLRGLSIVCWPLENGVPKADWMPRTAAEIPERVGSRPDRSYEERQRRPDDLEAQEGQRPIAIHALENLAPSDIGVVMLRRMLREQIRLVQDGLDPMNTIRDPVRNHKIPTNAWNTVLSPAEAALHQGEEI
ncbi:MAG TPA: Rieske 2Fe-2S domain-containing protein [Stellaceae bacterium]|nr:Rieske 2Fe-2S domain-containing protein [Stellaceae bacterium]